MDYRCPASAAQILNMDLSLRASPSRALGGFCGTFRRYWRLSLRHLAKNQTAEKKRDYERTGCDQQRFPPRFPIVRAHSRNKKPAGLAAGSYATTWAQCEQRWAAMGISLRHSLQGLVVGAGGAWPLFMRAVMAFIGITTKK